MDSAQWNDRLFAELVLNVGSPDDPLFLYADDDVLAKCSAGTMSPEEALDDFCRAFNSEGSEARFKRACRLAREWKNCNYAGPPPFLDALVMTVLAVTLPAIGASAANIYGRQRQLLGLKDTAAGIPPGYEIYVPMLWAAWNAWLQADGAGYGTPTAKTSTHWSNQGWARSQSFIRSRDKEDIYDYFSEAGLGGTHVSPALLLQGLRESLSRHPRKNPPLLARVGDGAYEDEFLAYLPRSLSFWTREKAAETASHDLTALLLWNEESEKLDLVVDLRPVAGVTGTEVRLIDSSPYTVATDDRYLYLYQESIDTELWFKEPLRAWPLNERLTVGWMPKRGYILSSDRDFGWIESVEISTFAPQRVLADDDICLELLEIGVTGVLTSSPIPGWSWIEDAHLSDAPRAALNELLDLVSAARRSRVSSLSDGLPLGPGNLYLEGGEPDLAIAEPRLLETVRVDGRDRLADLLPWSDREGNAVLRLSRLYLEPGEHVAELVTTSGSSTHHFRLEAPKRRTGHWFEDSKYDRVGKSIADGAPLGVATRAIVNPSESLLFRSGAAAFAILPGGKTFNVELSTDAPPWVDALGRNGPSILERLLETGEIVIPDYSGEFDLAYRKLRRGPWRTWNLHQQTAGDSFPGTIVTELTASNEDFLDFLVGTSVEGPGEIPPRLRQLAMSSMSNSARSARPPSGPTRPARRVDIRNDIRMGVLPDPNPYNDFLEWMSELDDGYCSLPKARQVFDWLWVRSDLQSPAPNFVHDVLARLEQLGHVVIERRARRLWIAPTVLATLPNARSLRVLCGGRPTELLAILRDSDDDLPEGAASELVQNLTYQQIRQTNLAGTPVGPDTYLIQLASNTKHAPVQPTSDQYSELAIWNETGFSWRLLDSIETMAERLGGRYPFSLEAGAKLHTWSASVIHDLSGGWRSLDRLPSEGRHFLRVTMGFSMRYGWWEPNGSGLSDVGWEFGRWAFQAAESHRSLVFHKAVSRQLLVPDNIPLPPLVSKALTSRTGILPRIAKRGAAPGRDSSIAFKVFENISIPFAVKTASILGQSSAGIDLNEGLQYE